MINYFVNKRTFLLLIIFILPFGIFSCSSKDQSKSAPTPTQKVAQLPPRVEAKQDPKKSLIKIPKSTIICSVTANKAEAWSDYSVTIQMINYVNKHVITILELPANGGNQKSVNSVTKTFDCQKYQQLQFISQFSPAIWKANKGKLYLSHTVYNITGNLLSATSRDRKLILNIIFPTDFIGIPALIVD